MSVKACQHVHKKEGTLPSYGHTVPYVIPFDGIIDVCGAGETNTLARIDLQKVIDGHCTTTRESEIECNPVGQIRYTQQKSWFSRLLDRYLAF